MYPFKSCKGFSLIELVVVMAIMAILMSLSGGLLQKSINQQERQVELEQVNQLFRKLSYDAYYKGTSLNIRLEKSTLKITPLSTTKNNIEKEYDFKQLVFVAQDYQVSSKGFTYPTTFSIIGKSKINEFYVGSIFNETSIQ